MKQIRQFLKHGRLEAGDVPLPAVLAGDVLVRTHFSFVSVGTERMKVTQARMNLAEKARERPDQVRQVLRTLAEQGLMPTLRKIEERLKAPTPLGYSCAGTVEAVGTDIDEFRVGDRVAAIGEGLATHAEFNAVPRNLVVRVPDAVGLDTASSSAIGAIALQSVRQAALELGESVAVIGLGLLGQFAVQLVRANGCRVVGVDLDPAKCALAVRHGAEAASSPQGDQALTNALRVSAGLGVDAVLVTTSTSSNQPIELAARLVRDRGRVVCLGNTQIELDWRTWFGKEIDFRFSRAMGAGMYDPDYLTRGKDFPAGYVRWTANRNMQAVLSGTQCFKSDGGSGCQKTPLVLTLARPLDANQATWSHANLSATDGKYFILFLGFKALVERVEDMWFLADEAGRPKNTFDIAPNFALRALKELHIGFTPKR